MNVKLDGYRFLDLVMCLSKALDLISNTVVNHHKRVAYVAYMLAGELGFSSDERCEFAYAGALHDCGAFSLSARLAAFEYDFDEEFESAPRHAELGYKLLRKFEPFEHIANLIRHHHIFWAGGKGVSFNDVQVLDGSHLLHLADRVEVLFDNKSEPLSKGQEVLSKIVSGSDSKFKPDHIEAFKSLAAKEYFWLDLHSGMYDPFLMCEIGPCSANIDMQLLLGFVQILSRVVDFRSRFTATHSSGVAAVAEKLGKLLKMSDAECVNLRLAGFVHDLGKLAVPTEILEKPGRLNVNEFNIIKSHTYHTYRTLEHVCGLGEINEWASFHHERVNGHGYPFHVDGDSLDAGARIMAVSDIFTALTEDRPYRHAMSDESAISILKDMAGERSIDHDITDLLISNIEEIRGIQSMAQTQEMAEYRTVGS